MAAQQAVLLLHRTLCSVKTFKDPLYNNSQYVYSAASVPHVHPTCSLHLNTESCYHAFRSVRFTADDVDEEEILFNLSES